MTYLSSPLSFALFAAGLAEKIDVGMAAEVSSLATTLGAYEEEADGESELVTRDLLGGGGGGGAGDVDLQLHVPAGWPTRIDLPVCVAARSSIHCSSRRLLEFQSDLAFIDSKI